MKLVARIAMVGCWMALVGCGGEESSNDTTEVQTTSAAVTCPNIAQPSDKFCPNGTIQPVYDGKCLVSYVCIP